MLLSTFWGKRICTHILQQKTHCTALHHTKQRVMSLVVVVAVVAAVSSFHADLTLVNKPVDNTNTNTHTQKTRRCECCSTRAHCVALWLFPFSQQRGGRVRLNYWVIALSHRHTATASVAFLPG